jgi:hypothetical protein
MTDMIITKENNSFLEKIIRPLEHLKSKELKHRRLFWKKLCQHDVEEFIYAYLRTIKPRRQEAVRIYLYSLAKWDFLPLHKSVDILLSTDFGITCKNIEVTYGNDAEKLIKTYKSFLDFLSDMSFGIFPACRKKCPENCPFCMHFASHRF